MTDALATPTVDLAGLPEPGDRGLLDISPTVAEKIARRAATEVDGTSGSMKADADVAPGRASIRLELGVEYPRPVGAVAAEVRRRVTERVNELTGLTVEAVDVTVSELPAPRRRARRLA